MDTRDTDKVTPTIVDPTPASTGFFSRAFDFFPRANLVGAYELAKPTVGYLNYAGDVDVYRVPGNLPLATDQTSGRQALYVAHESTEDSHGGALIPYFARATTTSTGGSDPYDAVMGPADLIHEFRDPYQASLDRLNSNETDRVEVGRVTYGLPGEERFVTAEAGQGSGSGLSTIKYAFGVTPDDAYNALQTIVSTTLTPVGSSGDSDPLPFQNSVDRTYYYAVYPDVARAGLDPTEHYAAFGWQEGRDPNAYFGTNGYLSANQDVDAANINPLGHYHQFGWKEGRDASVSFDTALYLINNADVRNTGIDPLEHFLVYGRFEGRQAYTAVGQNVQGTFDAEYYRLANPDVGLADVDAAFHFQNFGWKEGRDPNAFFDTSAYLAAYGDVAAAGINPLEHYNTYGWKEGRDPSGAFDTSSYLATYTDVVQSNINPLEHYLKYGIFEGRSGFSDDLIG